MTVSKIFLTIKVAVMVFCILYKNISEIFYLIKSELLTGHLHLQSSRVNLSGTSGDCLEPSTQPPGLGEGEKKKRNLSKHKSLNKHDFK